MSYRNPLLRSETRGSIRKHMPRPTKVIKGHPLGEAMNAVLTMYRSTVGKKIAMAVTGAIMVGWLLAHMLGNLQVFLGMEVFNHYAELIQSQQELLWLMRLFLIGCIGIHIVSIVQLAMLGQSARTTGYAGGRETQASTLAARSLRIGGLVILLFLVWHLADLTIGVPVVNPAFIHGDAYNNLFASLSRPPIAGLYILANMFLGAHIYHGVYSVFQTLGINQHDHTETARQLATGLAVLIAGGNITIALAIVTRIVGA